MKSPGLVKILINGLSVSSRSDNAVSLSPYTPLHRRPLITAIELCPPPSAVFPLLASIRLLCATVNATVNVCSMLANIRTRSFAQQNYFEVQIIGCILLKKDKLYNFQKSFRKKNSSDCQSFPNILRQHSEDIVSAEP